MFRKAMLIAASVALPAASFGVVAATSGTAGAAAPTVVPVTCILGGSLAFQGPGINENGTASATQKTQTSVATLTSSTTGCQSSTIVNVLQKNVKCSTYSWGPTTVAGLTLSPHDSTAPSCVGYPKYYEYGSAWAFAGGSLVNGVASSTTAGIVTALKKGIPFTDNGHALTLLVSAASALTGAGSACGTADAGFHLSGTVKSATSHTWSSNLCLGADTVVTGTTTSNTFLGDLAAMAIDTVTGTSIDTVVEQAVVDPSTDGGASLSSLSIS